jgi:hypothetical protein
MEVQSKNEGLLYSHEKHFSLLLKKIKVREDSDDDGETWSGVRRRRRRGGGGGGEVKAGMIKNDEIVLKMTVKCTHFHVGVIVGAGEYCHNIQTNKLHHVWQPCDTQSH